MKTPANQRRSPRFPCAVTATWTRQGQTVELEVAEISSHGLFLITDLETLPGALMQLDIALPDGQRPILLFAAARSFGETVAGRGIGAEIYVISNYDRERWARLFRAHRGATARIEADPLRAIA